MAEPLPDGVFPRLNASLLRSGSWNDCLASFVGKLEGDNTFRCCDGGTVQLQGEYFDPESVPRDSVVEIMGQTVDASSVSVFIVRELSADTDLSLYNSMIEVQHNAKFSKFFRAS